MSLRQKKQHLIYVFWLREIRIKVVVSVVIVIHPRPRVQSSSMNILEPKYPILRFSSPPRNVFSFVFILE